MNCTHCEEQLSDYVENALSVVERSAVELHFRECRDCAGLVAGVTEVMSLAAAFPRLSPPAWLVTSILANTSRVARETWLDTLTAAVRWAAEPRIAMAVLASTLMLSWMGSIAGLTPNNLIAVARDPAILYYEAGTLVNRAYGGAVRSYYRAPLVTGIQAQIERLREIS